MCTPPKPPEDPTLPSTSSSHDDTDAKSNDNEHDSDFEPWSAFVDEDGNVTVTFL